MPNLHEMDENGIFSCYICAKPKMSKSRYDSHMYRAHAYDLSTPDIEELAFSRANFEEEYEKYSGEEREKAYWDYDSETNRRYSEDDSNDDSGNEESDRNFPGKKGKKRSTGYNSSESSSSSSSINSQGRSSRKRKTKKKNNYQRARKKFPKTMKKSISWKKI